MDRDLVQDFLQKSGFTEMQSDALSHIVSELATKEDLARLEAKLETRLVSMEARLTWRMIAVVGFFGTVITLLNAFIR